MARFTEVFHKGIRKFTDAPDVFIKAGALFLLSTIAGRHVVIVGPRPQYLNLWFLQVGDSRVSRKTTVLYWSKRILTTYMPPRIPPKSPAGTKPTSPILIPSGFSPEAFFTILSENPRRAWIKDEMSGFINSFKKRYMADMPELLSKIYDCTTESRRTKTGGHEVAEDPYLTIYGASTPVIAKYFGETIFEQGLGNRFIYVVDNKERNLRPYEFFGDHSEHRKFTIDIVNHIKHIQSLVTNNAPKEGKLIAPFHNEAKETLNKFEEAVNQSIYKQRKTNRTDINLSYTAALPELVRQLAALFSIDRYYEDRSEWARQELDILPEAVDEAIDYAQNEIVNGFETFRQLIRELSRPEKRAASRKMDLQELYEIIRQQGSSGVKREDLYNIPGFPRIEKTELEELLNTLIDQGRVKSWLEPIKMGRPPRMYAVK